jgi:formylglycine-generating enzyme required for sulfatase activity
VETPQQQRRSAVGQFAQTVADTKLDFDAIDIIDMLWLAQFIEPGEVVREEMPEEERKEKKEERKVGAEPAIDTTALNLYASDNSTQRQQTTTADDKPKAKGMPFSVPAAPALRTRIDLARSLRPLMRKVPSSTRFDLDEDATVTRIAETEVWMPVVQSRPERWLELDLVVEDSKTTVIWERAIAELNHLAEYQGAFRSVRTWRLSSAAGKVQLFPRWRDGAGNPGASPPRPHTPGELIDPTGRRLIWLVTDCTSLLWQQDVIYETMLNWAKTQPIAIVQMFPEEFWSRTSLRNGNIVRLSALAPGLPTGQLEIEGLPPRLERRSRTADLVTVPIVTLDADSLRTWARVATGLGDSRVPGRTFDRAFIRKQLERSGDRKPSVSQQRSAEERVALFRVMASPTAQQLANLMAATAVSLPVIDLLREAFREDFAEEVQQSHVAEVLLSGLLRRCDGEEEKICRYEFFGDDAPEPINRVRDLLLGDASIRKTIEVMNVLSEAISRKLDSPVKSFQALLDNLQSSESELRDAALPFATVGLGVLRRLGGEYAELAQRYDLNRGGGSESTQDAFPFEDLEYEAAKFIDFPALQDCEYESATITAILDRFDFETATIALKKRRLKKDIWEIDRRSAIAWGYTEILGEEIDLDMIAIPGGSFTMGSPDDELERRPSESPQHDVTLQPFYLGRYAITQAQWRVVAGYDRIDRDLDPDPSRFKGDNLPVESVDWDDATEFCQRLSAATGKDYRLPSEAQWEYACRAGTTTPFSYGETIAPELVNYDGNHIYGDGTKGEYRKKTTEVGILPGNNWGLHDMHGNVWEWCEDDWHSDYKGAPSDGSAWLKNDRKASKRLLRGGSWNFDPGHCRSSVRNYYARDYRNLNLGFRVSCVLPRILPS